MPVGLRKTQRQSRFSVAVHLMSEPDSRLENPPIVEMVLDIECDLPPGQHLQTLETRARELFTDTYPKFRAQLLQEHQIAAKPGELPEVSVRRGVEALQFLKADEKQLVQVRASSYSFNRLAPYTTLADYLPEIERTWRRYVDLATPVQVRLIRLRYINRILLPITAGGLELNEYLRVAPHLPDEKKMTFVGFLNHHAAVEVATGHQVNIVLMSQLPEGERLPIILDNAASSEERAAPSDWTWILAKIQSLRSLNKRIFRDTLTEKCLNLFRQPSVSAASGTLH